MKIVDIHGPHAPFAPHQRLANAISAVLETQDECFPSDISGDFTDEEIETYWHLSYNLAQLELRRYG